MTIALVVGLLALFLLRSVIIFVGFLLMNAFLNYYQGKIEFPFDMTPSLVLMIIFSMKLGFGYGLIFLFLGSVVPSVIASGFSHLTFFFVSLAVFVCYLASLGIAGNQVVYGLVMIAFQSIFAFVIAKLLADDPMVIFSVFVGLVLNVVYLLLLHGVIGKILV